MEIEQKLCIPLEILASKLTHAALYVHSVFAILLLAGEDETQTMPESHRKGGLHSRTPTGSRFPSPSQLQRGQQQARHNFFQAAKLWELLVT